MRIHGKVPDVAPAESAKGVRPSAANIAGQDGQQPPAAHDRADRVQISDAGRARAASAVGDAAPAESMSTERKASIRRNVLEGAYDSVQVVDEVARRILARGDLDAGGAKSGQDR